MLFSRGAVGIREACRALARDASFLAARLGRTLSWTWARARGRPTAGAELPVCKVIGVELNERWRAFAQKTSPWKRIARSRTKIRVTTRRGGIPTGPDSLLVYLNNPVRLRAGGAAGIPNRSSSDVPARACGLAYAIRLLGHAAARVFCLCERANPNGRGRTNRLTLMAQPPTASPLFGTVPKIWSSFGQTFRGHDCGVLFLSKKMAALDFANSPSIKFATGGKFDTRLRLFAFEQFLCTSSCGNYRADSRITKRHDQDAIKQLT